MSEKNTDIKHTIKPAGRHILTIGRELIKDKYGALVELVKNAYDADSPSVNIQFSTIKRDGEEFIKIVINDEGHGMSRDDVIKKWLVPSTDAKLKKKKSPKGRILQGKKGIGRYAASILGDDLLLETCDESKILTTLYLIWEDFEKAEYLEQVEVLVESVKSEQKQGTKLTIIGEKKKYIEDWSEKKIEKLRFELKKLTPPIDISNIENKNIGFKTETSESMENDGFKITLTFVDFPEVECERKEENVEPYPLFDLYDYKISGCVSMDGWASLTFHNNKIINSKPEEIIFKIILPNDQQGEQAYCGEIILDLRVFDRERTSIEALIERGLEVTKNEKSTKTIRNEEIRKVRSILNIYNGIGVFRNGFRIRPLGDAGYDWLELDKTRVQKPTRRIGSDQVIGYILIQSEELSNLEEKSARDGLKENKYYYGLIEIVKQVLQKLEDRRYIYRRKEGLGRDSEKVNAKIRKLFEYDDLKGGISKSLSGLKIEKEDQEKILNLIDEKAIKHNRIVEEIKDIVAIYQKHATVGKIVNVVLHEGRHPLNHFVNQIPLFQKWKDRLQENYDPELLKKFVSGLDEFKINVNSFINLFNKLDPLAARKKSRRKDFLLKDALDASIDIFNMQLTAQNINVDVDNLDEIKIFGWKEDFITTFINLIDNSVYWFGKTGNKSKVIDIQAYDEDGELIIDYRDNGPGIEKKLIESEVIFDPEFSTKTEGTGLGLAIAGEAIDRNNGELKAIYSPEGAHFVIEIRRGGNE